jgi:uncharacterized RDD family membrane protein YckC
MPGADVRDTVRVYDVVTGEAVALDLRIAQLPSRLVAGVIDLAAMVLLLYVSFLVIAAAGTADLDEALAVAVATVLVIATFLGYPVIFEALTRGRSPGKMAMGLRVVRDDGGPITFRHALVRGLVGLALERPGLFLLGLGPALGMIVSMFSPAGKRIGDMAAGTIVLQERVSSRPGWAPIMPAPLAGWATTLDLTGLDDSLALSVRQFLGRAAQFDAAARERLGSELAEEVLACTTPAPPPGTPGWAYLTAVLAERRRREETRIAAAAGLPPPPTPTWPPPWWEASGQQPPGQYGPAQYGPAQHGLPQQGQAQHAPPQHGTPQHGPAQYWPTQHGPTQHGPTQHGPTQHGPTQHGPTQHGPT